MKKQKQPFVDDGRTVYSMDALSGVKKVGKEESFTMNKKERKAALKAACAHYAPVLLVVILSFSLVTVLMYLWLAA